MYLLLDEKPPDKVAAIDSDGRTATYGDLVSYIDGFHRVVAERAVVLVLCRNDVPTLKVYLACLANRIVPLLIGAMIDAESFRTYLSLYHPSYVFGDRGELERLGYQRSSNAVEGSDFHVVGTGLESFPLYHDLSLLLTTSGSTGSPKLVRHTYDNLMSQGRNISAFFEMDGTERPLVDLPIMYTYGLSVVNSHLYAGATLLLTNESITSRKFWDFFKANGATSITGVPYTFEVLDKLRFYRMDLPSLNMLSQGGGKLSEDLQRKFAEYIMARGGKYYATYGQTECSARMAYLPPELALSKCGSIGDAIPQGLLFLMDDKGRIIEAPHHEGEMYYTGPNVTLGYAETGADLIKGDEFHGTIATGDLAYMDEDGCFYITGRKKRFLKLYGHRVSLDECENIIRKALQIECACTGLDEKLVVCVLEEGFDEAIKALLKERTKLYANTFSIQVVDEIPRNDAGKVLYSKLNSVLGKDAG